MTKRAPRKPNGSVTVIENHGRLQLRFRDQKKRYYVSLGLPATPVNHAIATVKATMLELDLKQGQVDYTWEKYKEPMLNVPGKFNTRRQELEALVASMQQVSDFVDLAAQQFRHQLEEVKQRLQQEG